ncbi:uracil-DNA glycosylase [Candidatus Pelagibacter sp.]|nr:uracil-DNA glycosylase [Candidatus Pelagibacter sp.]
MSKKVINQNTNYDTELLNSIESDFIFDNNPINRLENTAENIEKDNGSEKIDKQQQLNDLKLQINSINDCNLKDNSKKIVLGDGNINSPIMLIGEAPGIEEDNAGLTFLGEVGDLLKKMLKAINIIKENIYTTYAVNFRPPEDRKPTTTEIKRYSQFLQTQISIIKPKIIILMGSSAMESLTGLNSKISLERGKWKEVIVKNTSYNVIITFNPSYLLRAPENKKYSWEDLKTIQKKIDELGLKDKP